MNITRTNAIFEKMAQDGTGDSGALAVGLRQTVTGLGLRALAAKMAHVAIAAPERTADIYSNAAAGWLSGPVFPPRLRRFEPIPVSDEFWRLFWTLMDLPAEARRLAGPPRSPGACSAWPVNCIPMSIAGLRNLPSSGRVWRPLSRERFRRPSTLGDLPGPDRRLWVGWLIRRRRAATGRSQRPVKA